MADRKYSLFRECLSSMRNSDSQSNDLDDDDDGTVAERYYKPFLSDNYLVPIDVHSKKVTC